MRMKKATAIKALACCIMAIAIYAFTYINLTTPHWYGEKPPQMIRYSHDNMRYYLYYPAYIVEKLITRGDIYWQRTESDWYLRASDGKSDRPVSDHE